VTGPQAFWSYVRLDDQDEAGRITQLSTLLQKRVRIRTGGSFEIFLDRNSIGWGDDWELKINEALDQTTFFIPIITPSYFTSQACRAELTRFASSADALGLRELVMPLYYVDVPDLSASTPSRDELVETVRSLHWEDWRTLCLEDVNASVHLKAVDGLATEIIKRITSADAKPSAAPKITGAEPAGETPPPPEPPEPPALTPVKPEPPPDSGGPSDQVTEPPTEDEDVLGVLVAGEAALPRLGSDLDELTPLVTEMGTLAEEAVKQMQKADNQGKGFAGRLAATRTYAKGLDSVADRMEPKVEAFRRDMLEVDPMINLLFTLMAEDPAQIPEVEELLNSLIELHSNVQVSSQSTNEMIDTMIANTRWSKELRRPTARLTTALRQVADVQELSATWSAGAERLLRLDETPTKKAPAKKAPAKKAPAKKAPAKKAPANAP
jgi:hypothetical protein